jgi:hypothetical protein
MRKKSRGVARGERSERMRKKSRRVAREGEKEAKKRE